MSPDDLRNAANRAVEAGGDVVSEPLYWRLKTEQLYALANLAEADDATLRDKLNLFLTTMGVSA